MNNEESESERFISHVLATYDIQPLTLEIAKLAARIRMTGLRMPDAIVVATAASTHSILITKDKAINYSAIEIIDPSEMAKRI